MSEIITIQGEVDAIGPGKRVQKVITFQNMSIFDSSENVVTLDNVTVADDLEPYVAPGAQGELHFMQTDKDRYLLFAFKSDSRKVYSKDYLYRLRTKGVNTMYTFAAVSSLLGVLGFTNNPMFLSFFLGTGFCLYVALKSKKMFSEDRLKGHLAKHGFAV